MPEHEHFEHAPITEAMIDIQVELEDNFDASRLRDLHPQIEESYPHLKNQILLEQEATVSADDRLIGFVFESEDQRDVFQARLNGMTLNRLAPYQNWTIFSQEARRLWGIYREFTQPEKITRLAVRYINRLDIGPLPLRIQDYLRTHPEIAPELPQEIGSYFFHLNIKMDSVPTWLTIVSTMIPPHIPDGVSIILDLDIFRQKDIPQTDEEIWDVFTTLRDYKNQVFESSLTEKMKELIR